MPLLDNLFGKNKPTALLAAVGAGDPLLVERLLREGAAPNEISRWAGRQMTALDLAVFSATEALRHPLGISPASPAQTTYVPMVAALVHGGAHASPRALQSLAEMTPSVNPVARRSQSDLFMHLDQAGADWSKPVLLSRYAVESLMERIHSGFPELVDKLTGGTDFLAQASDQSPGVHNPAP